MSSEHALFEFKRFAAFRISALEIGSSSSLYEESLLLSELSEFCKNLQLPGFRTEFLRLQVNESTGKNRLT